MTTHVVNFWLPKLFHVHVSGYPILVWNQPPRTTQLPFPCTEVRWQYQSFGWEGLALQWLCITVCAPTGSRKTDEHPAEVLNSSTRHNILCFRPLTSQHTHTHSCKTRLPQCWPDATRVWAGTVSPRRQSTSFITGKCSPALGMKAELSSNLLSSSSILTAIFQVSHLDQSAPLVFSLTPPLYGYYYSIIIIFD